MNLITEEECIWLGLPTPLPIPYRLHMVDQTVVQPVGLIKNVRIHIHGISYFITLTVIWNKEINEAYNMLLGCLWLIDAKVYHDWNKKVVTIQRNGIVKTISVNQRLGPPLQLSKVLVCYNSIKELADEEDDQLPSIKKDFLTIDTIPLPGKLVGVSSQRDHLSSYPNYLSTYTEGDIKVDNTHAKTQV